MPISSTTAVDESKHPHGCPAQPLSGEDIDALAAYMAGFGG